MQAYIRSFSTRGVRAELKYILVPNNISNPTTEEILVDNLVAIDDLPEGVVGGEVIKTGSASRIAGRGSLSLGFANLWEILGPLQLNLVRGVDNHFSGVDKNDLLVRVQVKGYESDLWSDPAPFAVLTSQSHWESVIGLCEEVPENTGHGVDLMFFI